VHLIGANIKKYRLVAGLTQQSLAQALGTEVETVSRYERGLYAPPIEQIEYIARLLGISPWVLLASKDEEPHSKRTLLADQIDRLSNEDATTLARIIKTYVDAHGRK
jgi:Predicted transcriptional regulators